MALEFVWNVSEKDIKKNIERKEKYIDKWLKLNDNSYYYTIKRNPNLNDEENTYIYNKKSKSIQTNNTLLFNHGTLKYNINEGNIPTINSAGGNVIKLSNIVVDDFVKTIDVNQGNYNEYIYGMVLFLIILCYHNYGDDVSIKKTFPNSIDKIKKCVNKKTIIKLSEALYNNKIYKIIKKDKCNCPDYFELDASWLHHYGKTNSLQYFNVFTKKRKELDGILDYIIKFIYNNQKSIFDIAFNIYYSPKKIDKVIVKYIGDLNMDEIKADIILHHNHGGEIQNYEFSLKTSNATISKASVLKTANFEDFFKDNIYRKIAYVTLRDFLHNYLDINTDNFDTKFNNIAETKIEDRIKFNDTLCCDVLKPLLHEKFCTIKKELITTNLTKPLLALKFFNAFRGNITDRRQANVEKILEIIKGKIKSITKNEKFIENNFDVLKDVLKTEVSKNFFIFDVKTNKSKSSEFINNRINEIIKNYGTTYLFECRKKDKYTNLYLENKKNSSQLFVIKIDALKKNELGIKIDILSDFYK